MKTIYLKHARTVSKSGGAYHIYLPAELAGKDILGVIVRDREPNPNDSKLPVYEEMTATEVIN